MTLDFSKIDAPLNISTDFVLSKISQEQIFYQYFGDFVPYKGSYHSVFRKDSSPSTGFYYGESGKLKYKDLGTGESWDCFSFVAKLYGIKYNEAAKKIACDFGLVKNGCNSEPIAKKSLAINAKFDKKTKEETIIQIIAGAWTKETRDYWKSYGITREELEFHRVFPVEQLFINKNYIGNPNNDMRFAYLLKTSKKEYMKIYTPFAKDRFKWVSNIPLHIPFGMDSLNYDSKTIVVTKSLKDMVILRKIFPAVIGLQNESEGALNSALMKHLVEKFEKRIIIFDNDDVGVEACKKFNDKGFDYFNIPKPYALEGIKDPSDLVKSYGIAKLKHLLKEKQLL